MLAGAVGSWENKALAIRQSKARRPLVAKHQTKFENYRYVYDAACAYV
jgi:hypothetical protein